MSTLAPGVPETARVSGPSRCKPSGLTWLVWRQHRALFRLGIVCSLAMTGFLVYWHASNQATIGDSTFGGSGTVGLPPDVGLSAAAFMVWMVPLLVGVAGAQLFEREFTAGTFRLVCAQSMSRGAWVRAKLLVPAAVVILCVTPCAAALTWDYRLDPSRQWYSIGGFDTIGPVAVAFPLVALFLGAAAGLTWRSGGPAKGLALALVLAFKAGVFWTLPRLLPTTYITGDLSNGPQTPSKAWVVESGYVNAAGHHVAAPANCLSNAFPDVSCEAKSGLTGQYATYLPYSDLQSLQWIATGICVIACAALAYYCLRLVRRP